MQHHLEELIADLRLAATHYVVGGFLSDHLAGMSSPAAGRPATASFSPSSWSPSSSPAQQVTETEADAAPTDPMTMRRKSWFEVDLGTAEIEVTTSEHPVKAAEALIPDFQTEEHVPEPILGARRRLLGWLLLVLVFVLCAGGGVFIGFKILPERQPGEDTTAADIAGDADRSTEAEAGDADGTKASAADVSPPPRRVTKAGAPYTSVRREQPETGLDARAPLDDAEDSQEGTPRHKTAPRGRGTLFLDTRPWSKVRIGGRSYGNTPVVGVSLPAGFHTVRLVDADGQRHTRRVRIRPDKATKIFLRLSD
jgi:hypothetical protein